MYQVNPPLSPRETLPTMYDLPSEDPGEFGVPDEFHSFQPELLRLTFRPPNYASEEIFTGSDLNLYYDVGHTNWYKRPDWFGVVGGSRFYQGQDLRLSYVVWQEGVNPLVVVELLSPGTEQEDLGKTLREVNKPPTKWQVYEQVLQIPYYFVFNRYTDEFQAFKLVADRYQPLSIEGQGVWVEETQLGLGLWRGLCKGNDRLWLRWFDSDGSWVLTPEEQETQRAEQEAQRAKQEAQRAEREKQRADSAELELASLRRLLIERGVDL
jgi:Uma2 family endonuclease